MKYDFFNEVLYSFELIIKLFIFKCKVLIQLSTIDKV
jgi:hypothetical protein